MENFCVDTELPNVAMVTQWLNRNLNNVISYYVANNDLITITTMMFQICLAITISIIMH